MTAKKLCLYFMLISVSRIANAQEHIDRYPTAQERLYEQLLKDYRKNSRPVKDQKSALNLSFSFELIKIYEVNAKQQRMSVVSLVRQEWRDESLCWNASDYSGFSSVNMSPNNVWVPDVDLHNEVPNKDHKKTGITTHIVVDSNGRCRWTYPLFLHIMCSIDVSYFPLDLQQCSLRFGSLTYTSAEIHIMPSKLTKRSNSMSNNGEWLLYRTTIKTEIVWDDVRLNNFSVVELTFSMERNSGYYFVEMLVPCFLISCLTILGFVLPPESGERMSLGMLILLAMTFFQQLTMKMVPLQDFPLISQYFFITTIEIGIALLIMTITLNFYHHSHSQMPGFLKLVVIKILGKITRFPEEKRKKAKFRSSYKLERKYQVSTSSRGTDPGSQYDIELTELNDTNNSTKNDVLRTSLNDSTVGLVRFRSMDENSSTASSFEMRPAGNGVDTRLEETVDNVEQNKIEEDSNKDWILASRILDRFSMYASVVIGILTILIMFLRAPRFWTDRQEGI